MEIRYLQRLAPVAVLLAALLGICPAQGLDLRVHFIAVGHGDAILIEGGGRGLALVDAGKPEAGSVVLDYLRSLGLDRLEHLFVTHTHPDHLGGVLLLLDSLQVGTVHHTGMTDVGDLYPAFNQRLAVGPWAVDTVDAGRHIALEAEEVSLEVLHPEREETAGREVPPNPHSMVLLLRHGQVQVLLAADIDKKVEHELIERYGDRLRSQGLKVPHHGSGAGSSARFLETVRPEIAVVCVGPNTWGYPSGKTLKRLKEHCPAVLRTDEDGTVILHSDGRQLTRVLPERSAP
ncbi:MAG: MBL fold metallo-hydrolase [Candidatus Zixiibacteriota bacterium]|nr:MAG: MBL fold metallo-hydrolase [candidate division Zixibacteria bacterium]